MRIGVDLGRSRDVRRDMPTALTIVLALGRIVVIAAVVAATPIWATPLTFEFTVTATSGPLAGTSSSGTFSFDSGVIPPGGGEVRKPGLITHLAFIWNGIRYDETTANTGVLIFDSQGRLVEGAFGNYCPDGEGCGVGAGTNDWFVDIDMGRPDNFAYMTPGSSVYFGNAVISGPKPMAGIPTLDTWALYALAILLGVSTTWILKRHTSA